MKETKLPCPPFERQNGVKPNNDVGHQKWDQKVAEQGCVDWMIDFNSCNKQTYLWRHRKTSDFIKQMNYDNCFGTFNSEKMQNKALEDLYWFVTQSKKNKSKLNYDDDLIKLI